MFIVYLLLIFSPWVGRSIEASFSHPEERWPKSNYGLEEQIHFLVTCWAAWTFGTIKSVALIRLAPPRLDTSAGPWAESMWTKERRLVRDVVGSGLGSCLWSGVNPWFPATVSHRWWLLVFQDTNRDICHCLFNWQKLKLKRRSTETRTNCFTSVFKGKR